MASITSRVSKSSFPTWEYAFLKLIGAPQNDAQLQALNYWARAEGMPDGSNNWLAFTAPTSNLNEWGQVGSSSAVDNYGQKRNAVAPGQWNVFHNGDYSVLTYPTMAAGVSALYDFLQHGHEGILTALRDPNATVTSIGDAVNADRGWGGDGKKIIAFSEGKTGIYSGGGTVGGGKAQSTGGFTQCDSSKSVVGSGGIFGVGSFTLINDCQAKAIVAGFTIGLGMTIMGMGLNLTIIAFALGNETTRQAISTGLEFIPGGKAAGGITKQLIGIGKASVKSPAKESDESDNVDTAETQRAEARQAWEQKYGRPWSESAAATGTYKR